MTEQRAERQAPSRSVVFLTGELDAADTDWVDDIARALSAGTPQVVVDMHDVTFIDSSVVRALLLLHRRVPPGGWLRLVYSHYLVRRVIEICGLAQLFPQYPSVEAAGRGLPARHTAAGVPDAPSDGHTGATTSSHDDAPDPEGPAR